MPTPPSSPEAPSPESTNLKAEHLAGKRALKELLEPVRWKLTLGRILALFSGILAIAPYIALVHLGGVLLARCHEWSRSG